jgi:hypothetical protein
VVVVDVGRQIPQVLRRAPVRLGDELLELDPFHPPSRPPIWMPFNSPERTAPAAKANWLPAPAGPFRLVFRLYIIPGPTVLNGTYQLPGITAGSPD